MATKIPPSIRQLSPSSANTHAPTLVNLINRAYGNEQELWNIPDKPRTCIPQIIPIITSSEFLVALSPTQEIVGCVQVHPLSAPKTAGLGMLAVSSSAQGQGLGRLLVQAGEKKAKEDGFEIMQLEILRPRGWKMKAKEVLKSWYEKLGYEVVEVAEVELFYPALLPFLACECELVVFKKSI